VFVSASHFQPGVNFHQHFWHQSRTAFAQIFFDAFTGNSIWQKLAKKMVLGTKAVTKNMH
jgi:hypothetical protein